MKISMFNSAITVAALCATAVSKRDHVQVAGFSSTRPYSSIADDVFGESVGFLTSAVEPSDCSTWLKNAHGNVCEGMIDLADASRIFKENNIATFVSTGETEILEMRYGHDSSIVASDVAGNSFASVQADWRSALAVEVEIDGKPITIPDIMRRKTSPDLPAQDFMVIFHGFQHSILDALEVKVIKNSCKEMGALARWTAMREGKVEADKSLGSAVPLTVSLATDEFPVSSNRLFCIKPPHLGAFSSLKVYAKLFFLDKIVVLAGRLTDSGSAFDLAQVTFQTASTASRV